MPTVVLGGEGTLGAFYLAIVKGPTLDVVGVSVNHTDTTMCGRLSF
jgi:hypothetical protein